MRDLPLIGITQGDPSGIGLEIAAKALSEPLLYQYCLPIIFGEKKYFKNLKKDIPVLFPDHPYENSSYAALELATQFCLQRKLGAMVTLPVNKNQISTDEGIKFLGHTDYLKEKCERFYKKRFYETMFFVGKKAGGKKEKIALVTTHIPLRKVSTELSADKVKHTILNVHNSLLHTFGVQNPRIALLGLNPHAGDGGLLGEEEKRVLLPAIRWARKHKFDLHGPFPADSFFATRWNKFDATVALYHDQGLIPFKQRNFLHAVNVTLGLPIIRTSVDHGVAYDIAGSGKADPSALFAAIELAAQLSKKGSCLPKGRKI